MSVKRNLQQYMEAKINIIDKVIAATVAATVNPLWNDFYDWSLSQEMNGTKLSYWNAFLAGALCGAREISRAAYSAERSIQSSRPAGKTRKEELKPVETKAKRHRTSSASASRGSKAGSGTRSRKNS